MGLFSNILEKLGLKKKKEEEKPAAPAAKPVAKPDASAEKAVKAATAGAGMRAAASKENSLPEDAAPAVKAIEVVDVVAQLEERSKGKDLNWKVSIVDLLKLLELDSSKDSRIELAKELGCPAELIGGDYSKMNVWLHKEVLRQIAANGGNIPKELLD